MLGVKGLTGGLRVELLTDWPERLAPGAALWLDGDAEPRQVVGLEAGGRVPVLYLEGIDSRELAEPLAGRFLEATGRPLPAGSYYWHQLVGLRVTDPAGNELGMLTEVFRAGGAEVYRVEGGRGELLVPALQRAVRSIDLAAGTMVVDYSPEEMP